jgi:hypothetical protein
VIGEMDSLGLGGGSIAASQRGGSSAGPLLNGEVSQR